MKRKGVYVLAASLAVVVTITLVITLGVFTDPTSKDGPEVSTPEGPSAPLVANPTVTPAAPEPASPPGSPQESIVVHGHWTIEVRNPDGSLVERREFDNDLTVNGIKTLAGVMGREYDVGGWIIWLLAGDPSPFSDPFPKIVENAIYPAGEVVVSRTLQVAFVDENPDPGDEKLVLHGTAIADQVGTIVGVTTQVGRAPGSGDWVEQGTPYDFTSKDFTAVALTSGQQVSVTVEISFSPST